MARNPSLIEKLAINRVTDLFLACEKIQPWLPQGDKEPLWDGFLYLYTSSEWANRDMKGRIACQVKGKDVDTEPDEVSYSIEVCDLQNYLRDGGVLFFLVHVGKDPSPIFWARLAPVDIRGYLTKAGGNQSTSIKLERMPGPSESEQMAFEFYEHCLLQQRAPVDASLIAKTGKFKTSFKVEPGENPILALTKGYHYLYSCDDKDEFGGPVGDTQYSFQLEKDVAKSIFIAGEEFKVSVKMRVKEGCVSFIFDRFMTMDLKRADGTPRQLTYNVDKLFGARERYTALRVLLAMDAAEAFIVDGKEYACAEVIVKPDVRTSIQEELIDIQKVVELLDRLHVPEDLVVDQLSDRDTRELNTLYEAIINNRLVKPESIKNEYQIINVAIGPLTIKVLLVKEGEAYRVCDFFAAEFVVSVAASDDSPKHEVGRFALLEKNDYIHTSNIDWTLIPSDYARIYKGDVELLHVANQDVLNMLLAYDECGKTDLLAAAQRLADWLVGACDSEEEYIYKVNYLQSIKRQREFNLEEQQELISLSESSTASNELKYCCALLLDDIQRAQYHYRSMPKDKQDIYRALPINHFYKLLKN